MCIRGRRRPAGGHSCRRPGGASTASFSRAAAPPCPPSPPLPSLLQEPRRSEHRRAREPCRRPGPHPRLVPSLAARWPRRKHRVGKACCTAATPARGPKGRHSCPNALRRRAAALLPACRPPYPWSLPPPPPPPPPSTARLAVATAASAPQRGAPQSRRRGLALDASWTVVRRAVCVCARRRVCRSVFVVQWCVPLACAARQRPPHLPPSPPPPCPVVPAPPHARPVCTPPWPPTCGVAVPRAWL